MSVMNEQLGKLRNSMKAEATCCFAVLILFMIEDVE